MQIEDDSPKKRLPEAVGVPRRFAVGSLMIIVTMYAVLFATLTSLGADPVLFGMVAVLFSGVGVGQALLFQGTKPREASVLVGAVLCPLMLLGLFVAHLVRVGPEDADIRTISQVLSGMAYLTMPGIALGYLAGCSAAGVFFVIDRIRRWRGWPVEEKGQRRSSEVADGAGSERVGVDERLWRRICAINAALSLRQKGRPVRGALNVFVILVVLVGLAGPFCPWAWWMHVVGTLILAFTLGPVLYGIGLCGWRCGLLFPVLGAFGALGPGVILRQIFVYPNLRTPAYIAYGAAPVLGLFIGALAAATLGWTRWLSLKSDGKKRRRTLTTRLALGAVLGLALLFGGLSLWLYSISRQPAQRALRVFHAKDLPFRPSSQTGLSWHVEAALLNRTDVRDGDLRCLSGLNELRVLDLGGASISDAGLRHLEGLTSLVELDLTGTRITGTGLKHLSGLSSLQGLYLGGTDVGDAGLAHLRSLSTLTVVYVSDTQVSDAGLAHLRTLANLQGLVLTGTAVTDAGLVHLEVLPSLGFLDLSDTQVTGTGLRSLEAVSTLRVLRLCRSRLSDPGLQYIGGLTSVETLDLEETRITDRGLFHLKRMASLRYLYLNGTQVTGAGLGALEAVAALQGLGLRGSQLNDAGLEHVGGLAGIALLDLGETQITDAGLVHLKRMSSLLSLELSGTEISDAGLEHLKGLTNLGDLNLQNTRVTIDGVNKLERALPNCRISYDRDLSQIEDASSE